MRNDAYTIHIFVPDGDPEGVRIVDRMNWTGLGIAFPREKWLEAMTRPEFSNTGIYVLIGHDVSTATSPTDDDVDAAADALPMIYIGQGDGIRNRIQQHYERKDFWTAGFAFVSKSGGLNSAHVQWLEYEMVRRAKEVAQCKLNNVQTPQEPSMSESEKADVRGFLREIYLILPLLGVKVFETPRPIIVRKASPEASLTAIDPPPHLSFTAEIDDRDTIIVPAKPDGFNEVFIGEKCWYAVRISGGMRSRIRWVAGYQVSPISAITHVAPVDHIEPYGDQGKYKIVFSAPATKITDIPFGDAVPGLMLAPRYTSYARLLGAKKLTDLLIGS